MRTITAFLQLLVALTAVCLLLFWLATAQPLEWKTVWNYRTLFFNGWITTIALSSVALLLSTFIGLVAALLKRAPIVLVSACAKLYVEIIRGTPLLVQILFFYYVIAYHVGLENRYVAGMIILSLFHGAYIAEMIRAGIDMVSKTQLDSVRAIGLSRLQAYRFVIFPQALRQVIPPLAGQFASIIKDSSLLSIIGINEVTNAAQQINSATYSTLESFFPLAAAYLVLTLPISLCSKYFERRMRYET